MQPATIESGAWSPPMASTASLIFCLALLDADPKLGHADAQAGTNVAGFLAHAMVGLGHPACGTHGDVHGLEGVV